ncbi:MAG: GTP 3',8-cyclase MoaA [Candidatus Marinimicrobia bacterium]|nr:GTP 3',8-cyclase MoaA [Candidatus Neomarinimicrobiota bacterium]
MEIQEHSTDSIITSAMDDRVSIKDSYGRSFNYLRVAVNERCNLRCVYCMPEEGIDFLSSEQLLTTDEMIKVIEILSSAGVNKIRFTGGEPLIRKDIVELVSRTSEISGINSIHMTTNGIFLEEFARPLFDAGLTGLNISLDTLDHQKFIDITRRPGLEKVLNGLQATLEIPYPSVKLNVVAMRDFNQDEIKDFAELTKDKSLIVRFIELMPFDAHQIWKTGKFLGTQKIRDELKKHYPDMKPVSGTATEHHLFHVPGYQGNIGIIPSFTRSLCSNCNRIRLTADGKIRNCLYSDSEYDLMSVLRNFGMDSDIFEIVNHAMLAKPLDGFEAQKNGDHHRESMTQIGG